MLLSSVPVFSGDLLARRLRFCNQVATAFLDRFFGGGWGSSHVVVSLFLAVEGDAFVDMNSRETTVVLIVVVVASSSCCSGATTGRLDSQTPQRRRRKGFFNVQTGHAQNDDNASSSCTLFFCCPPLRERLRLGRDDMAVAGVVSHGCQNYSRIPMMIPSFKFECSRDWPGEDYIHGRTVGHFRNSTKEQ